MAFQEFYCDAAAGSNLNGGYPATGGNYPITYTNGSWNSTTNVFDPAGAANPSTDGVTVGDWVSIYIDGAGAPTGFIGRVTAVTSTTFTVSGTAQVGTEPTTSATTRTAKIGGTWLGPNAASSFPFNFLTSAATNASGEPARVNYKNGTTYSVTSGIVTTGLTNTTHQGYSSSVGDGGKAIFDASTNAVVILTLSTSGNQLVDLIFQNNGSSGTNAGVTISATNNAVYNCIVNTVRGNGFNITAATALINCEVYGCNSANTASDGGVETVEESQFLRCIFHDNTGSNNIGLVLGNTSAEPVTVSNCIFDTNGTDGIKSTGTSTHLMVNNCSFYSNSGDGIDLSSLTGAHFVYIENSLFISNTGDGIRGTTSTPNYITAKNCAFYDNANQITSATVNTISNSVTLTSSPFIDAANGDFRLNNTNDAGAACRFGGYGTFTQTAESYTGTVSYPVVGATEPYSPLFVHRGMSGGFSG